MAQQYRYIQLIVRNGQSFSPKVELPAGDQVITGIQLPNDFGGATEIKILSAGSIDVANTSNYDETPELLPINIVGKLHKTETLFLHKAVALTVQEFAYSMLAYNAFQIEISAGGPVNADVEFRLITK